jgi:hypothetical protein
LTKVDATVSPVVPQCPLGSPAVSPARSAARVAAIGNKGLGKSADSKKEAPAGWGPGAFSASRRP